VGLYASSGETLLNHGVEVTSVLKLPKIQSSCRDYPLIAYLKMNVEQLGKGNVIYYNNYGDYSNNMTCE